MSVSKKNKNKDNSESLNTNSLLSPIVLGSEIDLICDLLDEFYETYPRERGNTLPSFLVKGAFYAARVECRSNPDWISQSAHSARDVLYPLLSSETDTANLIKVFTDLVMHGPNSKVNRDFARVFSSLDSIYKKLSDLAHHGVKLRGFYTVEEYTNFSPDDYILLLNDFLVILKDSISYQQVYTHVSIDSILASKITKSKTAKQLEVILAANEDAKEYFFSKADEHWLMWLWKNGYLNKIKEKAADSNSYGFRMPELNYLFKVADKKPDLVTSIICSFNISSKNFNPEVVDQFTRIGSKLPSRCLKKIVKKMRDEGWIELMGNYTQYGFEYAEMFKTLIESGDSNSILTLAEAILKVRDKNETEASRKVYKSDNVFYINDISETKVFNYLVGLPIKYQEKALLLVINIFSQVSKQEGEYFLMDEDFFTLRLTAVSEDSYQEDYRLLIATIIEITIKLFSDRTQDKKGIYDKYFATLSKNRTVNRLKLFVLSLDPQLFIKDLKTEYFRIFETDKVIDVLYGAEYERSLEAGFSYLTKNQKRDYVTKIFDTFSNPKNEDEKSWKKHYASCILSTISKDLTQEETILANKNDFKIDPKYQPEPSIGKIRGGAVTPRSPINSDDFRSLTVIEIARKLRGDLSPKELKERYKDDDFLNLRDADGVAKQLKGDIKTRIGEYLANAPLFFDRENLTPHYTNAYLRGIKDTLADSRSELDNLACDNLFQLLLQIRNSGIKESFFRTNKDSSGRWLSSWNSVHSTLADLVEELIKQKDKNTLINFTRYRAKVFEILDYLLNFEDPIPEDEKLKTAKSTVKHPNESEYSISDPFSSNSL